MRELSSGNRQHVVTLVLVSGTTFIGKPSSSIGVGGLVSSTKSVSKTSFLSAVLCESHACTIASCPFVIHISVAALLRIITGMPVHMDNFPGISFLFAHVGWSHNALCIFGGINPCFTECFRPEVNLFCC